MQLSYSFVLLPQGTFETPDALVPGIYVEDSHDFTLHKKSEASPGEED